MKLLVIVPAYNEQESILATVHDICTNAAFADVLVINDCSKDDTEKILREHDGIEIGRQVQDQCSKQHGGALFAAAFNSQ